MREARARRDLIADMLAEAQDPAVELERMRAPAPGTVAELGVRWLAARHSLSPRTVAAYQSSLTRIGRRFRTPDRILPGDVSAWVGEMTAEGLAPGTVAGYVRVLRMVLDRLPDNPARHRSVELPRLPRRDPEPPDADDMLRLLAATSRRYLVATVLLEQTGARVSEAIGLRASDIDAEGRVRFRADASKSGRSRFVDVAPWLAGLLPLRGVERTALGNQMRRASERASVARVHPHLLRHRRATLWHQQGIPAVQLAYRLGHARPSMSLDTYTHVRRLHELDPSALQVLVEEALHV